MPQGGGEIALESGALKNSGLKVGDTTHIVIQGEPTEVKVVGEFHFGSSMASATVVGMDPEWFMPIAAPDGRVSNISIDLADGASLDTVKSEVTKVVPDGAQVKTRAELIKEQNKTIEEQLGFIQVFLLVFVVIAMFVGSFIIMNSFAMSVRQRVKEFALLRAVGASPGSVFGIVFLQAIVIGVVGSALGVAAGAGLLAGLAKLLESMGMPLLEGTGLTGPIIVISLVVGLAVTIVGALLPAREAALTHPVEAMRGVSGSREKSLIWRTLIGGLLLAVGVAAVAAAWVNEDLEQRRLIMGLGAGRSGPGTTHRLPDPGAPGGRRPGTAIPHAAAVWTPGIAQHRPQPAPHGQHLRRPHGGHGAGVRPAPHWPPPSTPRPPTRSTGPSRPTSWSSPQQ